MRTIEEIKEEICKVEKAQRAAARKQERCANRLAELKEELLRTECREKIMPAREQL